MFYRIVALISCFLSLHSHASEKKRVLILIHSRTASTLSSAEDIKIGLENKGSISAQIKRVPSFHASPTEPKNLAALPVAQLNELQSYDAIVFGSPVYFHSPAAEMMAFLQGGLEIWQNQTLKGKPAAVFLTSNNNGAHVAEESLRAIVRALHLEVDLLASSCSSLSTKPQAFGQCLEANLFKKTSSLTLPPVPAPVGLYQPFVISKNHVYINQIALKNGTIEYPGVIGKSVSDEQAKVSTQSAMLNVLAVLNSAVNGDLSKVKQAVQISGYFNTVFDYSTHSRLLDEASKLTVQFLGEEKGRHTRAAFGVSSLPANSPVEIQAVFELED